jgi:hypothetical protein
VTEYDNDIERLTQKCALATMCLKMEFEIYLVVIVGLRKVVGI